tara:strand:+ start:1604 stop:1786 length:183 start_codon:yes stop_codon:yes gene_type:complete
MYEMRIKSASYLADPITTSIIAIQATIDGTEMSVPLDPANRHYAAILEWVAEGNTIQDAE